MRFMPYTDSVLGGENWQGEIEAAVKIVDRYSTSSVNLLSSPHFTIDTNWLKYTGRKVTLFGDLKIYL